MIYRRSPLFNFRTPTAKMATKLACIGVLITANCQIEAAGAVSTSRESSSITLAKSSPRTKFTCPTQLEPLTTALLRDLPGYINRVSSRTLSRRSREASYAVIVSQPEFTPLPVGSEETKNLQDKDLHQVFFTVLERQYVGQKVNELQHYHWLFLAQTRSGWRIALMFSRLGPYPANNQFLTPPRESSQSITAQAIRQWLNNCQAGAIRP